MTLDHSAVNELLEAFRAGDGVDLIRESVRIVLQDLIEIEAAEVIGARKYERSETRTNERNGYRDRSLSTQAGDIDLRIPKLRKGSYFPEILEPRRQIDQALYAVVMEAYVHGVSTRQVDDLVKALGIDRGISKSQVSRICEHLDEAVEAFRTRLLGHIGFPYVYLDATYVNVRENHQVVSKAVVIATGVTADGKREVLGCGVGDSEAETFWTGFLRSLRARGLSGVQLVISDQHAGLVAAIGRVFQGAGHQRCKVHFTKNLLATIPKARKDIVAAAFRTIFVQATPDDVSNQWDLVADSFRDAHPAAAELMDRSKHEVLAFTRYPKPHWQKIWSTNPLERVNKEIKRRTNVVGIFPNSQSVIRLVGAILSDLHDEWIVTDRRYLPEHTMTQLDDPWHNQTADANAISVGEPPPGITP
jgi:transposase-like protein